MPGISYCSQTHRQLGIKEFDLKTDQIPSEHADKVARYKMIANVIGHTADEIKLKKVLAEENYDQLKTAVQEQVARGCQVFRLLAGIANGLKQALDENFTKPLLEKFGHINDIDQRTQLENNIRVGMNNMIETFMGLIAVIPRIYKGRKGGKDITKELYQTISQSVPDLVEDLSRLHFNVFFNYFKNIVRDMKARIPFSIFPAFDFKPQYFEINKRNQIQCSSAVNMKLVPEIGKRFKDQIALGCPINYAELRDGTSIAKLLTQTMMRALEEGFFPFWDDLAKNGYGDMPKQEAIKDLPDEELERLQADLLLAARLA